MLLLKSLVPKNKICYYMTLLVLVGLYIVNSTFYMRNNQQVKAPMRDQQKLIVKSNVYYDYTSPCDCRNETIRLVKTDENNFDVFKIFDDQETFLYSLPSEKLKLNRFSCNIYSTLRRGLNQKILSFSLFGVRNSFFYDKFITNMKDLDKLYPGWLLRITYDRSIDKSIICELECAKTENGQFYDNVDFCDADNIPKSAFNNSDVWSAFYMHPTMYRWLAIGDSFVEVFASRDSDGIILQREVDAVAEWFKSGKYAHLMRDHPWHTVYMLAGMWGLYKSRDLLTSDRIWNLFTDRKIAKNFHTEGQKFHKGNDQDFLGQYVYPLIKNNLIVHDSYLCQSFGGQAFPTKRQGDCYVGNAGPCDPIKGDFKHICPMACRHTNHTDWEYC